jgi:hypothetical protein
MQIVMIILAVIGAIVVVSFMGIWLMHGSIMGAGMACCGGNMLAYALLVLLLILGIGVAIYFLFTNHSERTKR